MLSAACSIRFWDGRRRPESYPAGSVTGLGLLPGSSTCRESGCPSGGERRRALLAQGEGKQEEFGGVQGTD